MTRNDERVLVLAPTGRDALLTCAILSKEGLTCDASSSIDEMIAGAAEGAAALLIAEEALPSTALHLLHKTLDAQPPWSDLPVIVLAGSQFDASSLRPVNLLGLRNVMVLERPVRRLILARTVAVALRARRRQYELRDHLEQRTWLLERERAARADAEINSRMKDEFLMTISHELRTPLTAIYGWARMLTTGEIRESQKQRAIETIERNARAQLQLIEDLLDVSRAISGKLRLTPKPSEIEPIVAAVVESMQPAAQAKGVRVRVAAGGRLGPILADPERVQQIVWNLLSNAIKFTPVGGTVRIRVEGHEADVAIIVTDSGGGIPREFLPYVFDRFRQSEGGTTRQHGGLGLGLAIVRHLVELHGGTVHADSAGEGKGSTFRVVLPRGLERRSPDRPHVRPEHARDAPGATARLDGVRILVVDDEPSARELFAVIVENAGAELKVAASVPEALDMLKTWWPHVLLSDIEMPSKDGYQLMDEVRALAESHPHPIAAVAITAHSRPEDKSRALDAGFQWHLPKPVEPAQLVSVVASLTGRLQPSTG